MISSTYTAAHNHPQLQFWGSSLSSEPHRHQAHISHSIYTCRQNIHTQFLKKLNHWKSLSMNKGLWWFEFCASQSITKEYLKLGSWREGSAVKNVHSCRASYFSVYVSSHVGWLSTACTSSSKEIQCLLPQASIGTCTHIIRSLRDFINLNFSSKF